MQKIVWMLLIVVLVVALSGVYLGISGPEKIGQRLNEAIQKINSEVQKLSIRVPGYIYTGEPVGYVVEFENGAKFYNSGDTGITADMKLVIGDYYKPDVAFLPIGNTFTMDAQAAAYAASLINPSKYIVPTHYESYPFLAKSSAEFIDALKKYNLRASPLVFKTDAEQNLMGIKTVWLGHNSWFLTSPNGVKILIDPSGKYNPTYPEKYKDPTAFGGVDVVLTHGHADHTMASDLKKIIDTYHPLIIAPMELGMWLQEKLGQNALIMNANKGSKISAIEIQDIGFPTEVANRFGGLKVNLVSADHSSSAAGE